MHAVKEVIGLAILIPLLLVFRPGGLIHRKFNAEARRREESGHGNFLTKPLWGDRNRWRDSESAQKAEEDPDETRKKS